MKNKIDLEEILKSDDAISILDKVENYDKKFVIIDKQLEYNDKAVKDCLINFTVFDSYKKAFKFLVFEGKAGLTIERLGVERFVIITLRDFINEMEYDKTGNSRFLQKDYLVTYYSDSQTRYVEKRILRYFNLESATNMAKQYMPEYCNSFTIKYI